MRRAWTLLVAATVLAVLGIVGYALVQRYSEAEEPVADVALATATVIRTGSAAETCAIAANGSSGSLTGLRWASTQASKVCDFLLGVSHRTGRGSGSCLTANDTGLTKVLIGTTE